MQRPAIAAAGLVVGVVGLSLLVFGLIAGPSPDPPTKSELLAFEARLVPLTREGGQVIEMGLKVGISDLRADHELAPGVVAEQARAWQADLRRLREAIEAIPAPGELRRVRSGLSDALKAYETTAATIQTAAEADEPAERTRLLDLAVSRGEHADDVFDDATDRIQRYRLDYGMAEDAELPPLHGGKESAPLTRR